MIMNEIPDDDLQQSGWKPQTCQINKGHNIRGLQDKEAKIPICWGKNGRIDF
jgi:hypothetical protein